MLKHKIFNFASNIKYKVIVEILELFPCYLIISQIENEKHKKISLVRNRDKNLLLPFTFKIYLYDLLAWDKNLEIVCSFV